MMASKPVSVGIIGATGAVGEEILSVMEKRNFPASQLKLFASEKSSGKEVDSKVYGKLTMEPFSFEVASKDHICCVYVCVCVHKQYDICIIQCVPEIPRAYGKS